MRRGPKRALPRLYLLIHRCGARYWCCVHCNLVLRSQARQWRQSASRAFKGRCEVCDVRH